MNKYISLIISFLNSLWKKPAKKKTNSSCFSKDNINKLNITIASHRISDTNKSELIFDPVGYCDWIWSSENNKNDLKKAIAERYKIGKGELYNMPKSSFTFRPIIYLLPSDSIIYQALVDKLIEHKRNKFSKQVFSNIILDVNRKIVFDKPVVNWLKMRKSIRSSVRRGNSFYFFSDIAGYFENIKIEKLCKILEFYSGRNEIVYIDKLKCLLKNWQFADAQGIIQPHTASSILAKIYLSTIDSEFVPFNKEYHRYVDEFHILTSDRRSILQASLRLSSKLRELGLNLNSSKCKLIIGEEDILAEISEDSDFFDSVDYHLRIKGQFAEAIEIVKNRFEEFTNDYLNDSKVNMKIFRYCLRKFIQTKDPCAIEFCFSILETNFEQLVDVCRYLAVFINNDFYGKTIIEFIQGYLKSTERNLYAWVQVWLLELLYVADRRDFIDLNFISYLARNVSQDVISRSISYLIIAKHCDDHELINFMDDFKNESSILVKRTLLNCCSKLPNTLHQTLFCVEENDPIDILVTKEYLQNNKYNFNHNVLI